MEDVSWGASCGGICDFMVILWMAYLVDTYGLLVYSDCIYNLSANL